MMWRYYGQQRPDFAIEPGPGQESVWDYPRPPRAELSDRLVEVWHGGVLIARSRRAIRLLETASPPGWYLPPEDVEAAALVEGAGSSICEWKGVARYWALAANPGAGVIGWSYPEPRDQYSVLRDHLAFYPGRVECFVDGERVKPQPGGFYGGWMTSDVVGPVKGDPNTGHW